MKLAERIFKTKDYYITSPFGKRQVIQTKAGATSTMHSGCDYGTHGKKYPQYAVENGTVISCGKASDGANYVWVQYPRLGIKCLHYHLDSINVTKNQSVNNSTILGYTGMTGKATGIHLHLGMKYLNKNTYVDPETYNYQEETNQQTSTQNNNSFFTSKGYFSSGDRHDNIRKVASFMYKNFFAYTSIKALGNYYGPYIEMAIKEFQKRAKASGVYTGAVDGCIGPLTLKALEHYGFKY